MNSSPRRFGQLLLVVAMLAVCGGHWMVLQSVAWSRMVVEFSRTEKFSVAVEKTFNGQNPCDLCQKVKAGQSEEQKADTTPAVTRLEFTSIATPSLFIPVRQLGRPILANRVFPARGSEPLRLPPRRA